MQTNKEHVRAHAFVNRRLVAAVVSGRADGWEHPFRRSAAGTAIGLVLAVVLVLGFLAYGWIRPGSGPALGQDTKVVIEAETGTRYLVDGGTLRPVTNLASALLAAGPQLTVQTLPRRRTAQFPRGNPVGLVGAPDDVPTAAGVVSSWWSACVAVPVAPSSAPAAPLALSFGVGSRPRPLADTDAVLVQGPDGDLHLVTAGVRHSLDAVAARTALGYAATVPVQVPRAWLAALRPGRAFRPVDVPRAGQPGPVLAGQPTRGGQVLAVRTPLGAPQYFVVQAKAVVAVTDVEARLLLGNPKLAAVNAGGTPLVVPEVAVAGATRAQFQQTQGWPVRIPRPVEPRGQDVCVAAGPAGHAFVGTAPATPVAAGGAPVVVRVPPGSAAVAETGEPGGSASGVLSLVDDLGRRYGIADGDTLDALGLAGAARLRVPAGLLAVVPSGPALDVATVRSAS